MTNKIEKNIYRQQKSTLFFSPNKECSSGTYGENCTYQCGGCLNAVSCDHVNGTCFEGCTPGWQTTDTCHKRMCMF